MTIAGCVQVANCGVNMKLATDVLKIVTHEDAELAKKPPMRAGEQDPASELEPANLVELLNDIDSIKSEIHERMRRIEAVKQAKSLLMEDAARTETLNRKLAEIGKLMNAVQSGFLAPESHVEDEKQVRRNSVENEASTQLRPSNVNAVLRMLSDSVTLPWPKVEEEIEYSALAAYEALDAERPEAPSLLVLEPSADPVPQAAATPPSPQVVEMPASIVEDAETVERSFVPSEESVEVSVMAERLSVAEEFWKRADEATQEAKRFFEESKARLDDAVTRQEQLATDYQAAQDVLNAGYQSSNDRLEEAARYWQQTEETAAESRRLLEEASAKLNRALSMEEQAAADFNSAQKSLLAGYELASRRLEEAERLWREADQVSLQAKQMLDRTNSEIEEIRRKEEAATTDLLSARQELTTAYQFAAVAAQRRLDSAEFFKRSAKWAVFAAAFSWVAMVWAVWFSLRTIAPLWVPCVASTLIVCLAITFGRLGTRED